MIHRFRIGLLPAVLPDIEAQGLAFFPWTDLDEVGSDGNAVSSREDPSPLSPAVNIGSRQASEVGQGGACPLDPDLSVVQGNRVVVETEIRAGPAPDPQVISGKIIGFDPVFKTPAENKRQG
jgi:hypothetical protein